MPRYRLARASERGYTLVELIIAISAIGFVGIVVIWLLLARTLIMGNCWVSDAGALRCVQVVEPSAVTLVDLQRHAWQKSVVTVADGEGRRSTYTIDADFFWNATCVRADAQ